MAWCHHCKKDVGIMVELPTQEDIDRGRALAGSTIKSCNSCQRPLDESATQSPEPVTAKVIPISPGLASALVPNRPAAPASTESLDDVTARLEARALHLEGEIAKRAGMEVELKKLRKVLGRAQRVKESSDGQ